MKLGWILRPFGCWGVGGGGGGFRLWLEGLGWEVVEVLEGCDMGNDGTEFELSDRACV